jgi:oxygen-independent coproporphyrinogen-3 oxidase
MVQRHSDMNDSIAIYVHIPFCSKRCGYCDFNTYTFKELAGGEDVVHGYLQAVDTEISLAKNVLGGREVDTIFFGGGTPTMLPARSLVSIIERIRDNFNVAKDAEITTEANPDTVNKEYFENLLQGGFNRISFGVQSVVPRILKLLDRTHRSEDVAGTIKVAHRSGFTRINADLIYGTPGESIDDWKNSLESVLALPIDHVSAYSLIVENGTKFAAQVKRGEVQMPDEDLNADKYVLTDQMLEQRGMQWYEVSNWAVPGGECRHNQHYWRSDDWWGIGAGAHSHVNGVRWSNQKLPASYIAQSEVVGKEVLTIEDLALERIMLRLRMREGIDLSLLPETRVKAALNDGLVQVENKVVTLTRQGRLLADLVIRDFVSVE